MSATYNFEQSKSLLAQQAVAKQKQIKDKFDEAQEKYKDRVKTPLDAFGGALTEDSAVSVIKSTLMKGGKAAANKLGLSEDTIKNFSSKIDSLDLKAFAKDPKGTLNKLFKSTEDGPDKDALKKALTDAYKTTKSTVKDEGEGVIKKAVGSLGKKLAVNPGESSTVNIADKVKSLSGLDDDIAAAMPKNPSALDIVAAQTRQQMRETVSRNTLGDAADETENVASKLASKAPIIARDVEQTGEDVGKTFKNAAVKGLKRMGEVDEEGGDDPVADVVGALVGVGTLVAGIFSHKKAAVMQQFKAVTPTETIGLSSV